MKYHTIEYVLIAGLIAAFLVGSLAHYETFLAAKAIENQEMGSVL